MTLHAHREKIESSLTPMCGPKILPSIVVKVDSVKENFRNFDVEFGWYYSLYLLNIYTHAQINNNLMLYS